MRADPGSRIGPLLFTGLQLMTSGFFNAALARLARARGASVSASSFSLVVITVVGDETGSGGKDAYSTHILRRIGKGCGE